MLEELVVDQAAIDGCSRFSGNDAGSCLRSTLVEMLPPSITGVHFIYVHNGFLSELTQFAQEAHVWFPALRAVRLSLVNAFNQDLEDLASTFRSVGIEMTWDVSHAAKVQLSALQSAMTEKRLASPLSFSSATRALSQLVL